MKFRVAFSISKQERKFRVRFWKWEIWRLDSEKNEIPSNSRQEAKGGFLSFKKKESGSEESDVLRNHKPFLQALFYPEVESRIMRVGKRLSSSALNLFKISFPVLKIRGTLGDPFYDSIAFGMSQGSYCPDWENENADWSAEGEAVLKTGLFHLLFFVFKVLYESLFLAFILWRGARNAKKNPGGENLSKVRRWIFLKVSEAI